MPSRTLSLFTLYTRGRTCEAGRNAGRRRRSRHIHTRLGRIFRETHCSRTSRTVLPRVSLSKTTGGPPMYESSNLRASLSSVALCLSAPRASSAAARPPPSLLRAAFPGRHVHFQSSFSFRRLSCGCLLFGEVRKLIFHRRPPPRALVRPCLPCQPRALGVYTAFPWKTTISSGARSAPKALLHFPLL